jgi:hypothetical protein
MLVALVIILALVFVAFFGAFRWIRCENDFGQLIMYGLVILLCLALQGRGHGAELQSRDVAEPVMQVRPAPLCPPPGERHWCWIVLGAEPQQGSRLVGFPGRPPPVLLRPPTAVQGPLVQIDPCPEIGDPRHPYFCDWPLKSRPHD